MLSNQKLFSNKPEDFSSERSYINSFIEHCIDNREIFFKYQPIVDVSNNNIAFCEALMRLNNSAPFGGGSIENLFEILEGGNYLNAERKLRDHSLETICQDLSALKKNASDSIKFSYNISAKLFDEKFCLKVMDTLNKSKLSINDLIIEITENREPGKRYFDGRKEEEKFIGILTQAKNYGFTFAADDYENPDFRGKFLNGFDIVKTDIDFAHAAFGTHNKSEKEFAENPKNIYIIERIESKDDLRVFDSVNTRGTKLIQGYYASEPLTTMQIRNMYHDVSKAPAQKTTGGHEIRASAVDKFDNSNAIIAAANQKYFGR